MDEVVTKTVINGGNYNSQQELKKVSVKCSLRLTANGFGVKITRYNDARGIVMCRNHEDAVSLFNALSSNSSMLKAQQRSRLQATKMGGQELFIRVIWKNVQLNGQNRKCITISSRTDETDINIYA